MLEEWGCPGQALTTVASLSCPAAQRSVFHHLFSTCLRPLPWPSGENPETQGEPGSKALVEASEVAGVELGAVIWTCVVLCLWSDRLCIRLWVCLCNCVSEITCNLPALSPCVWYVVWVDLNDQRTVCGKGGAVSPAP